MEEPRGMKIILGSQSTLKRQAVWEALRLVGIGGVEVIPRATVSGVNMQPVGWEETVAGARFRADSCVKPEHLEEGVDVYGVGIESGLMVMPHTCMATDIAIIVVTKPDRSQIRTMSPGFPMPYLYVEEGQQRGWNKTTLGQIVADKHKGSPDDPHSTLTGGRIKRADLLVAGLTVAFQLAFFKNPPVTEPSE